MFVPWLATREGTASVRDYIARGGREVELELGPGLTPGAVLEHSFGDKRYRVEVRGAAVLAARGATRRASLLTRDVVPALTLTGEADWEASLVRATFAMDADLARKRWAVIAQADLWHLALLVAGKVA